jgi:superfamily II DNA or RNA helicase
MKLFPEQAGHADILLASLKKHRGALDLSCTGAGKSVIAVEIAKKLELPTLIVAPLSVVGMWKSLCEEQGLKPIAVVNYEKLRSKNNTFCQKVGNQWVWNLPPKTLLIWDEAARLKSYNSIINKIAVAAKPCYNLLLSATIAESPIHMRASGYLLGLHNLRNYWCWARERGAVVNQWGALTFNGDKKILNEMHKEIVPAHGHGLTLENMSAYFPETQTIYERVDFGDSGEIASLYSAMSTELAALEESMKTDSKGAQALTLQLRARQKTELLKVPLLIERAQELLDEGRSVVIFCNFNATLTALRRELPGAGIICGEQEPKDREQTVKDFQADTLQLVLCNIEAGGVGISLHGKRPRASLITLSWNGPSVLQALGRVHRAGGSFSQQFILTAAGTIEERVEESIKEKIANMKILNEGTPIPEDPTDVWINEGGR